MSDVKHLSSPSSAIAPSETDVYAIHGADPEVLAYAMAKYSRSALTMKESLVEISAQRAEQFLNTFYFQYGHRSIADLAHIPFAIERLSLLAAIELVDEQRWDGQERSTRYQDFRRSGWYTPDLGSQTPAYTEAVGALFIAYQRISAEMLEALKGAIPRPEEMKPESYERTLKARAFDVARYLLPLATNTSLGQIVNARTLETQVSRLLTSEFAEIRQIGEKLRYAATEPAWNVYHGDAQVLCEEIGSVDENCACRATEMLMRPVKTAPTLVKYATPNAYLEQSRRDLAAAAAELMAGQAIEPAPVVDLLDDTEPLEVELATSLLYPNCHYRYRQLRSNVAALTEARRDELIALGTKHRGRHDELLRAFQRRPGLPVRHPDGYRRLPRHAPPPSLRAVAAGLHRCARLRRASLPGTADAGRGRIGSGVQSSDGCCSVGISDATRFRCSRRGAIRAILSAFGDALPVDVQDGLRGGSLYLRAAFRSSGTLQLPARRMGRCIRPSRLDILRWRSTSASKTMNQPIDLLKR